MPAAVMLPRSWYGGESEKFMVKNPTMVVTLVIVIASAFMRMLSFSAVILSAPSRINPNCVTRMCMLSAMASVRTMVGAVMEMGVSLMPI